jgi:sec-independent protein translocase protein TatC
VRLPGFQFRVKRVGHDDEVTVVEHLDELRNRLLISLMCLAVAFSLAFWRHTDLIRLLIRQVPKSHSGEQIRLVILGVGEQFKIAVTVSFWAAVIIALPVLFYQLYAYVIPAFNPDRSARTWPLLVLVPALFIVGAIFAYIVVIPAAATFLLGFDSELYNVQPRALDWYEFCVTMMLAMGLIFELPAAVLLLTKVGIVSSRLMRHYRRHAIVALAVVAAALPGVDPISMIMEFLPLLVLYEFSIVLARMVERGRAEEEDLDAAVPGP